MTQAEVDSHRRVFKIPGRVEDRKHFVADELTELTQTFNEMTDELVKQYTSLDEKVAERTKELEISKRAAEAANESKTLFIANISHELKTPLNGIMGMCAVCMEEDDILRIKQSLKTLYRSGMCHVFQRLPEWLSTLTRLQATCYCTFSKISLAFPKTRLGNTSVSKSANSA